MSNRLSSKRNEARRREAEEQARRQRRLLLVGGVVVLVLAVAIAVATTLGGGDGEGSDRGAVSVADIAGAPGIRGGSLPVAPGDGEDDAAIGQQAPVAAGADFDGAPVSIGQPGQAHLVMFVASWCPACQAEVQDVVAWLDAGGLPDDVEFTTVVTWLDDTRPNWPPDTWLEDEDYTGRVLVDDADGSIAEAYGQPATPYWVVIAEDGTVQARITGVITQEQMGQLASAVSTTG